jgi:hypothetical protein
VRTIVFHGDADQIVHPSNAAKIIEAKTGDTVERAKVRSSASRAYTRAVTRDKTGTVVVEQWLIHGSGPSNGNSHLRADARARSERR